MSQTLRMTPRERMLATFAGQPVDCFPVTAPYLMLTQSDHWTKITGLPPQDYYRWCLQPPEEHILEYPRYQAVLPFDIAQPNQWASGRDRNDQKIVQGAPPDEANWYRENTRTGERHKLVLNLHEKDQEAEWPQVVFSLKDVEEKVNVSQCNDLLANGHLEYTQAYVKAYGRERFTAGTIINSFYGSSWYVGLTNRFTLVYDQPELMHALIERLTRRNIEEIHAHAAAGCDAIFIDDATATKDMISLKMYREFSLPYLKRQVEAAQNDGMKAILIYFGGVADRVEAIVTSGADALLMETSMKGFTNDLETIAAQVNNRMLLFGNLNPLNDLELKNDAELEEAMRRQIAVGKRWGRFVVSTGSPLTPGTTLQRMQKYIELGHTLSKF